MIISRSTFDYQDKVLIEKIKVRTPFRYEAIFQDTGCFLYFKNQGPQLLSAEKNVQVQKRQGVLLKCGQHFLDLLRKEENGYVEVIVVHLFPEVLKKLYIGELPAIIEKQTQNSRSQVVASSDVISRFIDSLEFYFDNPALVNNDLLELKIKEFILLLVQSKNINSVLELIADLYSPKKVRLKEVIELHLFSNLKLEQLAKLCNLSLSTFKREFIKEYDDSPNNYITHRRIEKAQELLRKTKDPIGEVAREVGFEDQLYFARLFKKRTGSTPSDFRSNALV